jgi:hypothetical protein
MQTAWRHNVEFFEFVLNDSQGEGRGEDRGVDLFQQKRQGPDVVFMSVGQDNTGYQRTVFFHVVHVRDNIIDTQHIIFRKHQARVHNEQRCAVLENHHVEADLSETAQGNDF